MGNPIFRFTLTHAIAGSIRTTEMAGWPDAKLILDRDEDYSSLIERFEGAFDFYGSNGVDNGGWPWVKNLEKLYGPDVEIQQLIEVSFNSGVDYETIFDGLLDVSLLTESENNQAEIPTIRDSFWANFINRKDTPVDLQALTDLDEAEITPVSDVRIELTSQIVRMQNNHQVDILEDNSFDTIPDNAYLQVGYGEVILEEIEETYSLPDDYNLVLPAPNMTVKYAGEYTFEINLLSFVFRTSVVSGLQFFYQSVKTFDLDYVDWFFNVDGVEFPFTWVDVTIPGAVPSSEYQGGDITRFSYAATHVLKAGSDVRWYGKMKEPWADPGPDNYAFKFNETVVVSAGTVENSYSKVTADTVYPETNANAFLIHDAAAAIVNSYGLGVDNPFYSELLGSSLTNARTYDEDGCAWKYIILKGLQLRGYTLEQKPFFLSFDQWWKGINPILNLGLTYDSIFEAGAPAFTPDILPDLEDWGIANTSSEPILWTGGIPVPECDVNASVSAGALSDWFGPVGYSFEEGQTYKFTYLISADGVFNPADYYDLKVRIVIGDLFFNILDSKDETQTVAGIGASYSDSFEFVCPVGALRLAILLEFVDGVNGSGIAHIEVASFIDETEAVPSGDSTETEVIRVEEKFFFYDPVPVVNISNCNMERSYDEKALVKKVDIGYNDWQSENISGIDDPQSKRTYATPFKKIGEPLEIKSEFIAASLAIETTRRQKIVQSKDYKFDDKTFIVAINANDTSPDSYIPELDENFSSITGLLNPETRYNSRITPARNLLRWSNVIFGCLQNYMNSFLKFVGGEGNYDMASTMDANDCLNEDFDGANLSEKQNIPITDDYLHLADLFTIETSLSWDQYVRIRDNRTKAIGISQSESNHVPFFIKTLEYELCKSKAKITAWPKNYFDIQQTEFAKTLVTCASSDTGCGTDLYDREDSEGIGRVDSEGVCRVWV